MLFSCWRKNQPFGLPSRSRLVESSQRRWRLELENTRCVRQRWDWMFFQQKSWVLLTPQIIHILIGFFHYLWISSILGCFLFLGKHPHVFFSAGVTRCVMATRRWKGWESPKGDTFLEVWRSWSWGFGFGLLVECLGMFPFPWMIGGLVRESHQNSVNSRLGIIGICPDDYFTPPKFNGWNLNMMVSSSRNLRISALPLIYRWNMFSPFLAASHSARISASPWMERQNVI